MIEIKVTTREEAKQACDCGGVAVCMESNANVQIGGEREEILHELVALLESFDKHDLMREIWHEALELYVKDFENNLKQRCDEI